jgi:hypothetical protein
MSHEPRPQHKQIARGKEGGEIRVRVRLRPPTPWPLVEVILSRCPAFLISCLYVERGSGRQLKGKRHNFQCPLLYFICARTANAQSGPAIPRLRAHSSYSASASALQGRRRTARHARRLHASRKPKGARFLRRDSPERRISKQPAAEQLRRAHAAVSTGSPPRPKRAHLLFPRSPSPFPVPRSPQGRAGDTIKFPAPSRLPGCQAGHGCHAIPRRSRARPRTSTPPVPYLASQY